MEKEPWGCSKIIDECQKYSIKKCLLLAGEQTELASHPELITLQIINGNCSVYSDGIVTELKAGDVIQLVPNTKFHLRGHNRNDSFLIITYFKVPPKIDDELDD